MAEEAKNVAPVIQVNTKRKQSDSEDAGSQVGEIKLHNTGVCDPLDSRDENTENIITRKPPPKRRRRSSLADAGEEFFAELNTFTPDPLDVDMLSPSVDDGFGPVSSDIGLEDKKPEKGLSDYVILRAGGAEIEISRGASSLIGLLETALEADKTLEHLDCAKASPWILEIIKTYVENRLLNDIEPITIQVSAPVGDVLVSDRSEIDLLNGCSRVKLFELAFSAIYFQMDTLLDSIYKYLVIVLSSGSQEDIVTFLTSGNWSKEWKVGLDEHKVKKASEDDEEILGLDEEGDLDPEDHHKIILIPGDMHDEPDAKAGAVKFKSSGSIAKAIEEVRLNNISLFHAFQMLPHHFWDKLVQFSCVNRNFCVTRKQASLSMLLSNIGLGNRSLRVKQVDSMTLNRVCKYLRHHNGKKPAEIAKPIRSVRMEKVVEDIWDAEFINGMQKRELFQLTLAANYMDMSDLLHLACAKVATMIKGKSPEEIKQILGEEEEA